MESSVIVAIVGLVSAFIGSWFQRQIYKAQARKTNVEANTLEESLEQARDKQFFDQVMAFSSVSSQKLMECEEKREKLEEQLQNCKSLKEQLCEERIKLLRKVREYEPNYQSNNPAAE